MGPDSSSLRCLSPAARLIYDEAMAAEILAYDAAMLDAWRQYAVATVEAGRVYRAAADRAWKKAWNEGRGITSDV